MFKKISIVLISFLLTNTAFAGSNCSNSSSNSKHSIKDLKTIDYLVTGEKPEAKTQSTTK